MDARADWTFCWGTSDAVASSGLEFRDMEDHQTHCWAFGHERADPDAATRRRGQPHRTAHQKSSDFQKTPKLGGNQVVRRSRVAPT